MYYVITILGHSINVNTAYPCTVANMYLYVWFLCIASACLADFTPSLVDFVLLIYLKYFNSINLSDVGGILEKIPIISIYNLFVKLANLQEVPNSLKTPMLNSKQK